MENGGNYVVAERPKRERERGASSITRDAIIRAHNSISQRPAHGRFLSSSIFYSISWLMAIRDSGTAASWSNDRWPFPGDLTIKINESFLGGRLEGANVCHLYFGCVIYKLSAVTDAISSAAVGHGFNSIIQSARPSIVKDACHYEDNYSEVN